MQATRSRPSNIIAAKDRADTDSQLAGQARTVANSLSAIAAGAEAALDDAEAEYAVLLGEYDQQHEGQPGKGQAGKKKTGSGTGSSGGGSGAPPPPGGDCPPGAQQECRKAATTAANALQNAAGGADAAAEETENSSVAEDIANGHAYDKHVLQQGEYPEVTSRAQFQQLIKDTIDNPTAEKPLSGGRYAYWNSDESTVVITDPNNPDAGTAFRPTNGSSYYQGLH